MEDAKRQVAVNPIKITDELIINYGKLKDFINIWASVKILKLHLCIL